MDLPKGDRRITYVLDPSPIRWSKSNLEMDKKLKRTSNLKKGFPNNNDSPQYGHGLNSL